MGQESKDGLAGSSAESHKAEVNIAAMLPVTSTVFSCKLTVCWQCYFLPVFLPAVHLGPLPVTRSCPSPSAVHNMAIYFLPG